MIKTLRKFAWLIFLAVIAAVIIWLVTDPLEPRYHGKRLSAWADLLLDPPRLDPYDDDSWRYAALQSDRATKAIQAIGDKAIPYGLKWCRARNTPLRKALRSLADDDDKIVGFRMVSIGRAHGRSWKVFQALGPAGKSAIPQLVQLLGNTDRGIATTAISDLANIGTNAIPPILAALTDQNPKIREDAAASLGAIGEAIRTIKVTTPEGRMRFIHEPMDTSEQPVIEPVRMALLQSLKDSEPAVRRTSAMALTQCDTVPAVAVPALISALEKETSYSRTNFAMRSLCFALAYYTTNATPAVPLLIKIIQTPDTNQLRTRPGIGFRMYPAINALRQIDPVAAQPYTDQWLRTTNR